MPQVTKRPLNRIIFAFINCVKSATNTHRKSTRPSFNIKAQLRLNMCSSPGVLFWTNDQNLYPACVPPDVTLVRDTNQRSGVQNAIGVAHLNHMPATEDFLRHKISQPYSLFSGLSQKHPRLFFLWRMGCAISGLGAKAEFGERSTEDAAAAAYPREDQIQMIKESWKVIRDDIAKVGIIMFVR